MDEVELNINHGVRDLNLCTDCVECEDKQGALAYFKIVKTIINEYPDKTEYLNEKYQKVKILYEAKFGKLERELQ